MHLTPVQVHVLLWSFIMKYLKSKNILFLEDNLVFAKNTIEFLNIYFAEILHTTNIKDALNIFADSRIDIIISDIKVEDGSGLDFITKVREIDINIPIVVLSAHKNESFLFKAIPLGISSYELKPLSYDNFIALLNRLNSSFESKQAVTLVPHLKYDFNTRKLMADEHYIALTKKEVLFIELLINRKDDIITNEAIQHHIWNEKVMSEAALKNFILRLRKKVPYNFLNTVQSLGYNLITH